MTRARMRYTFTDAGGNAIQNARADLYLIGTTTPVSDAWDAETGGSAITSVLSDNKGRFIAYFDARKRVKLTISDNDDAAFLVDDPTRSVSFTAFDTDADAVPPPDELGLEGGATTHASTHQAGGADPIQLDDLAAPDDNTDLNVSIAAHGLTPKLPDDATKFLNGIGGYTTPPGTGGGGSGAPTDASYLVATAHAGLTDEVPVGATPGGELGGTWSDPTVGANHSGSAHADFVPKSIVTGKGGLVGASAAATPAEVPATVTDGKMLMSKAAEATGLEWGYPEDDAVFSSPGVLTVKAGVGRWLFREAVTIIGVRAAINTAPTGAAVILDVNKNGTTIFSTQANRPTIAVSGNKTTTEPTPDVVAVAAGDELRVDIDQIGSTIAGSDLTVFVRYRRT